MLDNSCQIVTPPLDTFKAGGGGQGSKIQVALIFQGLMSRIQRFFSESKNSKYFFRNHKKCNRNSQDFGHFRALFWPNFGLFMYIKRIIINKNDCYCMWASNVSYTNCVCNFSQKHQVFRKIWAYFYFSESFFTKSAISLENVSCIRAFIFQDFQLKFGEHTPCRYPKTQRGDF